MKLANSEETQSGLWRESMPTTEGKRSRKVDYFAFVQPQL